MTQNSPLTWFIKVQNAQGGQPILLQATMGANGTLVFDGLSVTGLLLTTAGVSDSLNKRFVTDAELLNLSNWSTVGMADSLDKRFVTDAELANVANLPSLPLLAQGVSCDVNSATPTLLYTVPAAKTAIIFGVAVRGASINLTTAKFSVGWNGPAFNNVIADALHADLVDGTIYDMLVPMTGATVGNAADTLKLQTNTLQGAAATILADVIGYLV